MKAWNYNKTWYHGSPFKLTVLREGSTITQDRNLARVFSHKPTLVSMSAEGIKHNGKLRGFLYRIAESIQPEDVYLHPHSSVEKGKEWLTSRELEVELIEPTQIVEEEELTVEEISRLMKMLEKKVAR